MVNADRVKRNLASLLMDDDCSNHAKKINGTFQYGNQKGVNKYMRTRRQLEQFIINHPEKFNILINKIVFDFGELKKAVSNGS